MHTLEEINKVKELLTIKYALDFSVVEDVYDSLVITYQNTIPSNAEEIAKFLQEEGYSAYFCDKELTCYSSRVAFIIAHHNTSFFIKSDEDEECLKSGLNLLGSSLEFASLKYHEFTGAEVYDYRDDVDHQFTNVNAQRDEDFWNEENINH